jgi:hypothetical protein
MIDQKKAERQIDSQQDRRTKRQREKQQIHRLTKGHRKTEKQKDRVTKRQRDN